MRYDTSTALIALIGFLFFSVSDTGIKLGSEGFSTLQVATVAIAFGLVPAFLHMWQQGDLKSPLPNRPGLMLLLSIFKMGQIPCTFYAFATMPMTLVYCSVFAMPLATNAMGALVLKEAIGPRRILAICIGFAGVLIALNPFGIDFELGHLALIGLPLFGAASNVVVRISADTEPLSIMGFWPNVGVVIAMGAIGFSEFEAMPLEIIFILMIVAVTRWLGTVFFVHSLRRGPVISASAMQYSQVIYAGLLGYFIFEEPVTVMTVIGSVVIIMSGLYIMLRAEEVRTAKANRGPHVVEQR